MSGQQKAAQQAADPVDRYIAGMVDDWPELTAEQRAKLSVLLGGNGDAPARTRP